MMRVRIRYFASIREALGLGEEEVQTGAKTLGELRDELIARSDHYAQALQRGRPVRMAQDQAMSPETADLHEGAEVAFFPPVTGG